MVDTSPSFPALVQGFFVDYLLHQRALSPHTIAAYRDTFRLLLLFAQKRIGKEPHRLSLTDIDAAFVLAFLDYLERDRRCSARSRNARLSAIKSFLKYAAHQDLTALASIERCLAIPQKRYDKPLLGFMTRIEMEAVIAAPDTRSWAGRRDHALFSLLYNTGARVSEAVDLKVADIVLDVAPTAHLFGKGRKHRSVPLWKATAATLRQWQRHLPDAAPDAHLFPNRAGGRLSRASVTNRLTQAAATAAKRIPALHGRTISPHTIRHTTAMHLLQSGVDITVIALWLGHEDPSTTHMYVEADMAMKEAALSRLQPIAVGAARYRPPDQLMSFLQSL